MGLAHAVITCVARDDLADGGAGGFAETIAAVRRRSPRTTVEVLISDCKGDEPSLQTDLRRPSRRPQPQHRDGGPAAAGRPAVGRLRPQPRPCWPGPGTPASPPSPASSSGWASARRRCWPRWPTCGRSGSTSSPSASTCGRAAAHLPVARWWTPEEFESVRRSAMALGFAHVQASPLTRSSYHAREAAETSSAGNVGDVGGAGGAGSTMAAGAPDLMERLSAAPASGATSGCPGCGPGWLQLGVDALLLSHGADLPWLTGYRAMPLERLTMLVLPLGGRPGAGGPGPRGAAGARGRGPVRRARRGTTHEDPLDRVTGLLAAARSLGVHGTWAAAGRLRPVVGHLGPGPAAPAARSRLGGSVLGHLPASGPSRTHRSWRPCGWPGRRPTGWPPCSRGARSRLAAAPRPRSRAGSGPS